MPEPENKPDPAKTPDVEKLVTDSVAKAVAGAIPSAVEAAVAAALKKQTDADASKKASDEDAKKRENESNKDAIARLEKKLADEKRTNALNAALSTVPFFDPADARPHLEGSLVEENGEIKANIEVDVSGVKVRKNVQLSEAVAALAKRKPHLVKADVKDGTGASGAEGGGAGGDPNQKSYSRADLLKGVDFTKNTNAKVSL